MILRMVFAALAAAGFAVLFHVKGKNIILAGLTGGLGYLVYLAISPISVLLGIFAASVCASLFSEILARFRKVPTTLFSIAGIIPIVPGAGMYDSMFLAFSGKTSEAITVCYNTLFEAGAIAMGIIAVSSLAKTVLHKEKMD